jgi:hypothetical protein
MASGFFEVRDDTDYFGILERVLDAQRVTQAKRTEDFLLLVLGLTHLREWIAPNYVRGNKPKNEAERFAAALLENEDYKLVKDLANHAKHQRRRALPETQTTRYVELWDDRDTPIDSWLDADSGPPSAREYGGRDILDVFESVIRFYREHWFSLPLADRLGGE